MASWKQTFPQHPDEEPGKFFHRLTLLAISNYCRGRKILPPQCFKKRIIEGHTFYSFERDTEGGSKELFTAIMELKDVFDSKSVSNISFLICGKSKENPIESLNFKFSFDPHYELSQITREEALEKIKDKTFAQLKHLFAVARALPPISETHFPVQFQLRYELNESHKENAPLIPRYVPINVNPNVHQLFGDGANDLAFRLQLTNGQGIEVWYYSLLIKSASEIDDDIAEFEKSGFADETTTDMNSTMNFG